MQQQPLKNAGQKEQNNLALFVALCFILLVFQQAVGKVSALVAGLFSYTALDPDGVFAFAIVHHVVQLALALCVVAALHFTSSIRFGFCRGNAAAGRSSVVWFLLGFALYVLLSYLLGYLTGYAAAPSYPLTAPNVAGALAFQLLTGPSQEVLYRALAMPVLVYFCGGGKKLRIGGARLSRACLAAAVLFALGQVRWSVAPLAISVNWLDMALAFVLGLVFGVAYEKTKSLLYPVLMHSLSGVITVCFGYLFRLFF